MGSRVQSLLLTKSDDIRIQFFRYIFVGGSAALLDTATLMLLNHRFGMHHLAAAGFGFIVGLTVNYLISIAWVFESRGNYRQELLLFALIGASGLALTELIMWLAVDVLNIPVLVGKMIALALVLAWNFGMRRKLVFAPQAAKSR